MADRATLDDLRARIAALENGAPRDGERAGAGPHEPQGAGRPVRPQAAACAREGSGPTRASEAVGAVSRRSGGPGAESPAAAGARGEGGSEPSEPERAFRKIERLACRREQASEALRRRLAREGFDAAAVEEALARAVRCGLIDDGRYAEVLVRSRLAQGRGRRGIAAELADLGIDADAVASLSEGLSDDEGEVERALALLDRRPPKAKNRRDAAYRRLVQKGFAAAPASTAARLWCEANPE